jgi:RHS repeat-associated protein
MKKLSFLSSTLIFALLFNSTVMAFHAPPWDTGHNSFTGDPGITLNDPGSDACPPNTCCRKTRGSSPVEFATGNFTHSLPVLSIPSYGPSIDVTLSYNSNDSRMGQFGRGWVHPYDERLIETTDGVEMFAICTRANGKRERFKKNVDGSFAPPAHLLEVLTKNSDGTFSLRERNGFLRRFNQDGRLSSFVDNYGNPLTFTYDSSGFMTRITDASNRSADFLKGGDGRVASITDAAGRTFRFNYDASGNLIRFTDPLSNVITYQYDAKNELAALQDPKGNILLRITYDSAGRVSQHVDGAETWTYTYSPSAKRTTKRDSQNNTWTFDYNDAGAITKRTDPMNSTEVYVYDSNLNVTNFTNKNGRSTISTYDESGKPLTIKDSLGDAHTFTYDPVSKRPLTVRDALGNVTRFEYNTQGSINKVTNALGQATSYQYDARGLLTRITDPLGNSSAFTYDNFGNLTRSVDSLGNENNATFNILGQVLSTTDAEGRISQNIYDDDMRLVRALSPRGDVTTYEYDAASNVVAIALPNGGRTSYQYDTLNRLIKVTNPLGQNTSYVYDKKNNLITRTDGKGQSINYSYDTLSRMVSKNRLSDTVSYTYDRLGNLLAVTDGDSSLSFVYDALSRLMEARTNSAVGQPATVIRASYDALGNRKTMTDPNNGITQYAYDALSRLTTLTDASNQVFTFEYDALSRRTKMIEPGGLGASYTYDQSNRLTSIVNRAPSGDTAFTYTYDRTSNRQSVTDSSGLHSFKYDSLSRLIVATHPPNLSTETYSYDSVDNRTVSHLAASYTYDLASHLLADSTFDYVYDANGNLIRKTERSTGKVINYSYDAENELVRIDFPSGTSATYRYDGLGRRIEKNINGQITRYVYDGLNILTEYSATGTVTAQYTHVLGIDEALSVKRGGAIRFAQTDALGSVLRVTDQSGAVKASYTYDSFGQIISETGSREQPYAFQGREFDQESGLYYFRARYYDPRIGRFISEDPIGFDGGQNLYAFANNNPVNVTDPLGLKGNPEYCRKLLETINNIIEKIRQRERELRDDPLDLPGSCAGDDKKPSLSRSGHQRLINQDKANLSRRQAEYLANCSDGPPNGAPAPNESFFDLKYWQRITGLSGAALIAYLIISEGSRIVFPPRNLVPAP